MAASAVVTVRIDPAVRRKLERLAKETRRSKSFLAAAAITQYIESEAAFLAAVEAGVKAANAGDLVEHEDVAAWVDSWGGRERRRQAAKARPPKP